MSSFSKGRAREIDGDLSSEVDVIGRTLCSSSDETLCASAEETCSEWRSGMIIFFYCFLEDEKIVLTLNSFFIVGSFFNAEDSVHDYANDEVRILWKESVDACFTFEVCALLDVEELGEVK